MDSSQNSTQTVKKAGVVTKYTFNISAIKIDRDMRHSALERAHFKTKDLIIS